MFAWGTCPAGSVGPQSVPFTSIQKDHHYLKWYLWIYVLSCLNKLGENHLYSTRTAAFWLCVQSSQAVPAITGLWPLHAGRCPGWQNQHRRRGDTWRALSLRGLKSKRGFLSSPIVNRENSPNQRWLLVPALLLNLLLEELQWSLILKSVLAHDQVLLCF